MDGGGWQATGHGVAKSRTRLSDFTFTFKINYKYYLITVHFDNLHCLGTKNGINKLHFKVFHESEFEELHFFKKIYWRIVALQCCQFLLYNKVNQLYVYIHPLPLELQFSLPSHTSRSSQSTELSSLCYIQLLTSQFTWHICEYMVVYICES